MFLIDDILLSPIHGLLWVFREINAAAAQDKAAEPATITAKLGELYMMLEAGQMTEAEFDAAEKVLLDRLDFLNGETSSTDNEDEEYEDAGAQEADDLGQQDTPQRASNEQGGG